MRELELVATEALLAELIVRFEHCLFAGLRVETKKPTSYIIRFSGQHHAIMGLATQSQMAVMEDLNRRIRIPKQGN